MKKILITLLFVLLFSFTFACAKDVSTPDGTKPSDETRVEQTDSGDDSTGQTGSDINPNNPTDSDDNTGENNGSGSSKGVELPEIPL